MESLFLRARQLENNILIQEHESIISLINAKMSNKDLQKYMLNKISAFSLSTDSASSGSPDSVLNALVANSLESAIEGRIGNPTEFLANRIYKNDMEMEKVKKANITVFDEPEWQPVHEEDRIRSEKVLRYNEFKFKE